MRKIVISIFAALILAFTLLGCGETEPLNVKKVTCVSYVFDPRRIYMTNVSDDLTIKFYEIYPESDNNPDLLAGELPPYKLSEKHGTSLQSCLVRRSLWTYRKTSNLTEYLME